MLPSARSGVLLTAPAPRISPWWRRIAVAVGIVAILIGATDAALRAAAYVSTADLSFTDISFSAFAPGVLVTEPGLLGRVQSTSTAIVVPVTLRIPAINVEASVEKVGKKTDGSMDTPKKLANVAWYEPGSKPGEEGNAVFAGHVNNSLGLAGVFKDLSQLKKGDTVEVEGEGGVRLTYAVEEVSEYFLTDAPLEKIFAQTGPSSLVLVTCQGSWDSSARTYDKRLVVVARLINP